MNLAPALEHIYLLAKEYYPKGTACPTCGKKISSMIIKNEKILFSPFKCVFALVRETGNITINPGVKPKE